MGVATRRGRGDANYGRAHLRKRGVPQASAGGAVLFKEGVVNAKKVLRGRGESLGDSGWGGVLKGWGLGAGSKRPRAR